MSTRAVHLLEQIRRLAGPPVSPALSDADLLARFLGSGDENAFAALVSRYGTLVYGVARRVLADVHSAEDAAQATWLILSRKAGQIRPPSGLAAWLHGVARQVALTARRKQLRRRRHEEQAARQGRTTSSPDPLQETSVRELLLLVDEELARLPNNQRLPVILCLLEGKSREETAQQLGWTPGAVKGRLERGRAQLQKRLLRRGLTLSAPLVAAGLSEQVASGVPPSAFAAAMAKTATAWSAGTTQGVPANVLGLATACLRSLAIGQVKRLATVLLAVSLSAAGSVVLASRLAPRILAQPRHQYTTEAKEQAVTNGSGRPTTDFYGDPLPFGALMRLGTVRLRHGGMRGFSFSADGKTLVSVDTKTARFWDAVSGVLVRSVRFPPLPAKPIVLSQARFHGVSALSRGGKTLAVWDSQSIHFWDIASGKEQGRFPVHFQGFGSTAFLDQIAVSADGKNVVLALEDPGTQSTTIELCDLVTRKTQWKRTLVERGAMPQCGPLGFSPDGKLFTRCDPSGRLDIWDAQTGHEVRTLQTHPGGLAFSPDNKLVVTLAETEPVLWDAATWRALGRLPKPDRNAMYVAAFSPDGRTLAIGDNDEVLVYDVPTRKLQHRLPHIAVNKLAFSPDGRILASARSYDGAIRLWDVLTGKPLQSWVCHDSYADAVVASPDGKHLASIASFNRGVYLWDVSTGRCQHVFRDPARWTYALCFSADGKRLISGADEMVYCWDIASGKELERFTVPDSVHGMNKPHVDAVHLPLDGRRLAAISGLGPPGPESSRITVWDTSTRKIVVDRSIAGFYHHWFSPDGTVVAFPSGPDLMVEQVLTGRSASIRLTNLRIPLAFSSDSRLLAVGKYAGPGPSDKQQGVTVVELATGKPVCSIDCGDAPVIEFAPQGRLLATANSKRIRLWDLASGKEAFAITAPLAPPSPTLETGTHRLAFLPDGRRLARGMSDTTILIWDVSPAHEYLARAPRSLPKESLRQLWSELAGGDAARAYQAGWALQSTPAKTIDFLNSRLRPVKEPDSQRLRRLVADLDSRRFAVREAASQELAQMETIAEPALRQALEKRPSAEMRRRLEKVLAGGPESLSSVDLRTLRAIAVLEGIGSAGARELLRVLATGAPNARVTNAARAALQRLRGVGQKPGQVD